MTIRDYNETRVNKDRIKASNAGKKIVQKFIKTIIDRSKIEHPEYDMSDKNTLLLSCAFYFIKYLATALTEKKDRVEVYSAIKIDDEIIFTSNIPDEYSEYRNAQLRRFVSAINNGE